MPSERNGRMASRGPDRISHEVLKAMLPHPVWGNRLLELFNDMLYTVRIASERGSRRHCATRKGNTTPQLEGGLEFFIAKLDIRKAFDSIFQESLESSPTCLPVCWRTGQLAWEARAWVALLHAQQIQIHVNREIIPTP